MLLPIADVTPFDYVCAYVTRVIIICSEPKSPGKGIQLVKVRESNNTSTSPSSSSSPKKRVLQSLDNLKPDREAVRHLVP